MAPSPTSNPTASTDAPSPVPGTLTRLVFQNGLPIPEFSINQYSGVDDTYISQGQSDTNFVDATSLNGQADPISQTEGSLILIRFDLSSVPPDTQIDRATLSLHRQPNDYDAQYAFVVRRLRAPVALERLTYNNFDVNAVGEPVGQFHTWRLPIYGGSWYDVDITEAVRLWVSRPISNFGMLIKQQTANELGKEVAFFSADYTSDGTTDRGKALTPKLTVETGSATVDIPSSLDLYRRLGSLAEEAHAFAEPILAVINKAPPDFQDDFAADDKGWRFNRGAGVDTVRGTMEIQDGVMRISDLIGQIIINGGAWTVSKDFVFEVDARLVKGDFSSIQKFFFHQVAGNYFNIHL